jgi:hypothetical protein
MKNNMQENNSEIEDISELIEKKLLDNLQWSMLLFVFKQICEQINSQNDFDSKVKIQSIFFKEWKKFAIENIIKQDLNVINNVLNSPVNIFYSILQNKGEEASTTEDYQEIYNNIIKKIEKHFNENIDK